MADARYGIAISQQGIPVKRAADYQKVLDDRWPFLDIVHEVEVPVEVRLVASTGNFYWAVEVFAHNLGFLPAFTCRVMTGTTTSDFSQNISFVATKTGIYAYGFYISGDTTSFNFKLFLRVYSRDVTQEFEYATEVPDPLAKRDSRKYGARILKDGVSPAKFTGDEMSDFSLHNNAKVLAIQQTGVLDLNPWVRLNQAKATAIATGTDIFTITSNYSGEDISWTAIPGQAVTYLPFDYATYPGGIAVGTYYIIPVGSNEIKLANTYKNALVGVAVDITSAGSLPGTISATENPSNPQERIHHNVGYPPSYWMSRVEFWATERGPIAALGGTQPALYGEDIIYPIDRGFDTGFAYATSTYIRFRGAQAVAGGTYAYILFKDPLERSA